MIVLPVIEAGVGGATLIAIVLDALLAQALFAVTEIVPLEKEDPKFTFKLVPVVIIGDAPRDDVIPDGNVHVYEVAPAPVKVILAPVQIVSLEAFATTFGKGFTTTVMEAELLVQPLLVSVT